MLLAVHMVNVQKCKVLEMLRQHRLQQARLAHSQHHVLQFK
jgi:hypothetical protein